MDSILPCITHKLVYIFLLINAGSALDDSRSHAAYLSERSNLALSIIRIDWIGKDRKLAFDLSEILKQKGVIVSFRDNYIEIGDIVFDFNDGIVSSIHYFY